MLRQLDLFSLGAPAFDASFQGARRIELPDGACVLEDMRVALGARYGEDFVRVTCALYRDGNDSVAFHGDTTARDLDTALVATVSLGAQRRLLVRPTEGGPSRAFELGGGDLFVMGGTSQRTWRHGIPKVRAPGRASR